MRSWEGEPWTACWRSPRQSWGQIGPFPQVPRVTLREMRRSPPHARLDFPVVDDEGNPLPGLWGDPGPPPLPVEKVRKRKEEKAFQTRTVMQCVPMKSKRAEDVLAAVQELYMRFRRYGYPIFRLHTDSGTRGRSS